MALLLCFLANCLAQRIVSAKLYGHLALNDGISIPVFEEPSGQILRYKWLAPAIRFQYDNNRYNEWELTDLVFQKAPDSETDTRLSIGLRYETGIRLTKNAAAPLEISLGGSLRGFTALEQLNDTNILGLAAENTFYGLSLAITPHLQFRLTPNLVFNFSPYVELANGTVRLEYVYDEFIDEDQRGSVDFYFRGFQSILRFGLGWKF